MSRGVRIMKPLAVTDAVLVSSTVPEADEPEWLVGSTYAVGDQVQRTSTHSVYENDVADNLGNPPELNPDKWRRVRATNRWRLFDGTNSSRTEQANAISYVFDPDSAVTTLAALNLRNCTSVRVRQVDPVYGTVTDQYLYPGPLPVRADPWEWAFGQWTGGKTLAVFDGLKSYPNAALHVDFVGGAELAVGLLMFGQMREWGVGIKRGGRLGRKSYSRNETNNFGDLQLVKRPTAKRTSFETLVRNAEVDPLMDYLDSIDATVCLFIGPAGFESTVVYGVYRDHEVLLEHLDHSILQLDVLGAP